MYYINFVHLQLYNPLQVHDVALVKRGKGGARVNHCTFTESRLY